MKRKRRRLSQKELERQRRARAEEKAKTRIESEYRQERIKVVSREVKEGSEHVRELAKNDDIVASLLDLVGLQKDEINYMWPAHWLCKWAETYAPKELEAVESAYSRAVTNALLRARPKLTAKQASEWRRTQRRQRPYEVGLIEYEFGGQADARAFLPGLFDPSCLDAILNGHGVEMEYLEILFEVERHRFPNKLPSVRAGRKIRYSAFAVVKIMDGLLKERLSERKPRTRGGSEKKLWLSNPDRRKRVLLRIGQRAHAFSKNKDILAVFMDVVCRHLPLEYLKEQLPECFKEWLALAATCPNSGK